MPSTTKEGASDRESASHTLEPRAWRKRATRSVSAGLHRFAQRVVFALGLSVLVSLDVVAHCVSYSARQTSTNLILSCVVA